MSRLVISERVGQVAVVTLNRPKRHNSLVPGLLIELLETINIVGSTAGVRAMVLRANGRNFSTGGDALGFVENLNNIEDYSRTLVGLLNQVILALFDLRIPVVAAIQGMVTGGSIGLVLAADIVLVTNEASFKPYYSVVGASPDGGWTALLPSMIGRQRAASILMLNQTITAEQAVNWGIASRIVPSRHIRIEALETAKAMVEKKPGSIYHTKRLLNFDRASLEVSLDMELEHFIQQIETDEGKEGFVAFMRKLSDERTSNRIAL